MPEIRVTRPYMPPFAEYTEEIRELWDSRQITNMGKKHRQFQASLERYLSVPHTVLYANGHLALESALELFSFPPGSEVITTPFTFASTVHAIVRKGLIPVFCDIRADNFTIDTAKIPALITEKTVAILPVHTYGNLCDVEGLAALAARYGLTLIYDAAHAFGVTYKGVSAAAFGDVSVFSFHATKVFHTIEGGAQCFHDDRLLQASNDIKNFGIRSPEEIAYRGGNAKMSEFQAAMGLCNLRHVEDEIRKRKEKFLLYQERLEQVPGLRLNRIPTDTKANYAYMPVVFSGYPRSVPEVVQELRENHIEARRYFYPLVNDLPCYRDLPTTGGEKTPVAREIVANILTLPLYGDLETEAVESICKILRK